MRTTLPTQTTNIESKEDKIVVVTMSEDAVIFRKYIKTVAMTKARTMDNTT
ncbi:hypothetical protein [Flavobacterium sp.]|uniref:hypothetical protein n=1 Tax=Flavobacterium sp. TaxID=239 RepID=UPI0037C0C8D5